MKNLLADEYGIMVWEDFIFACAMYPAKPDFLERVRQEVETQVKRLQYHPSLAIWATNNENEAALRGNWYGTSNNFTLYEADYVKLYIQTIIPLVNQLDPSRDCLPSSPTNGIKSLEAGGVDSNPYNWLYGDVHFYNYYADGWGWEHYPKSRYVSEYGFQAFPSMATFAQYTDPEQDWTWYSDMMEHRQRHPLGQGEIFNQIKTHLPLPSDATERSAFIRMLYMTQITQSMSVKAETEVFRRLKGHMLEDGTQNFGALYWQLNDEWPGASWASIEINGRWKMLHYYARNFFAPTMISPYKLSDGKISIHAITDLPQAFQGQMRMRIFTLDNLTPEFDDSIPVSLNAYEGKEVIVLDPQTNDVLSRCENEVQICILYLTMDGVPDNFLFLKYPTHAADVPNPNLRVGNIAIDPNDQNSFTIELTAETVAPFVFLNVNDNNNKGWFNDNGFVMVEGSRTITYKSQNKYSLRDFARHLDVVSLHYVV